ncbi:MAG: translation initiation factor [Candidatus Binatia bacterium]
MAKDKPPPAAATAPRALGSLADLLRQRGVATNDPPAAAAAAVPATPSAGGLDLSRAGRLVVRRERKGHGGKTVTVVDGLARSAGALDALAQAMRKALGCGSWVDGGRIVLQGDRPDAAAAWLTRHGARQVTRGN